MTISNTFAGMRIVVDGNTTTANGCSAGLRRGTYTLTSCDCCPEHLFWRHENDARVCGECWPRLS